MMNDTMKVSKIFGLAIALVLLAALPKAQADCGGCADVQAVQAKMKSFFNRTGTFKKSEIRIALDEASKVVLALPRGDGNKLNLSQIHEVVQLLPLLHKLDPVRGVLEDFSGLIRASKREFSDEIKKLPPTESKEVATDIYLVLAEEDFGNDSPDAPVASPTPAKAGAHH